MVNELDRLLELSVACGNAGLRIAVSIIADTGHGKTQRLKQFAESFPESVYYVPANTTAFKIRKNIRDRAESLGLLIIDDFSWIPDYDKHNMASLIREVYDGVLSKDSKEGASGMSSVNVHASIVVANNEKTLRSRFITELENQGIIDRFIPFRYTHTNECSKYIRQQQARARNRTPPTIPKLSFRNVPKNLRVELELSDHEVDQITDQYNGSRYSDMVIGLTRVAYQLGYTEELPQIMKYTGIGRTTQYLDVRFKE